MQNLENCLLLGENIEPLDEHIINICIKGNKQQMYQFISQYSNPFLYNFLLGRALVGACMGENVELVEEILSLGFEPYEEACEDSLEIASVTGNIRIVRVIVNKNICSTYALVNAFYVSCASNQITVMKFLLHHVNFEQVRLQGFLLACLNGCLDVVVCLFNQPDNTIPYLIGLKRCAKKESEEMSEISSIDFVNKRIKSRITRTNTLQIVNYFLEKKSNNPDRDLNQLVVEDPKVDLVEMLNNGLNISLFNNNVHFTKAVEYRNQVIKNVTSSLQNELHHDVLQYCVACYINY